MHSVLLYPFWGGPPAQDSQLIRKILFNNNGFSATYRITDDVTNADAILMPYAHKTVRQYYPELLDLCAIAAKEADRPLVVDGIEDVEHPLHTPNTFVLRYGGYRFERTRREIIVPPFTNDLLELYQGGELSIRAKNEKPIIGFTGWGKITRLQTLRATTKELPDRLHSMFDNRFKAKKKGIFFRMHAIQILARSPLVVCDFIARSSYSGHIDTVSKNIHTLQKEFVDTLLKSDYGLDVRGDANASTRLFEILSLGRIPVVIDTERNFPFSDKVDYSSFALIVDFRDIRKLPERIAEFHKNISSERFEQMQRNARDTYVRYFRIDVLGQAIMEELRAKIASSKGA